MLTRFVVVVVVVVVLLSGWFNFMIKGTAYISRRCGLRQVGRINTAYEQSHQGICSSVTHLIVPNDSVCGQRKAWSDCVDAEVRVNAPHCIQLSPNVLPANHSVSADSWRHTILLLKCHFSTINDDSAAHFPASKTLSHRCFCCCCCCCCPRMPEDTFSRG